MSAHWKSLNTERIPALVRLYTSPDENAFFPGRLPAHILTMLHCPHVLHPNCINITDAILALHHVRVACTHSAKGRSDINPRLFDSIATADPQHQFSSKGFTPFSAPVCSGCIRFSLPTSNADAVTLQLPLSLLISLHYTFLCANADAVTLL